MCQARGLLFLPARLIIREIEHTRRWNRGEKETEGRECMSAWLKLWCPFALVFFPIMCLPFSTHRRQQQERVSVYSSPRSRRQIREKHRSPISEAEFDRSLVPRATRKNIKITTVSPSYQNVMCAHRETDAIEGCTTEEKWKEIMTPICLHLAWSPLLKTGIVA